MIENTLDKACALCVGLICNRHYAGRDVDGSYLQKGRWNDRVVPWVPASFLCDYVVRSRPCVILGKACECVSALLYKRMQFDKITIYNITCGTNITASVEKESVAYEGKYDFLQNIDFT